MIGTVFVALFVGHMVGDHVAQTDWLSGHKAERSWRGVAAMAGHLGSYLACQAVALVGLRLAGVPVPGWPALLGLAVSIATHGFIDRRWPVRWLQEHTGSAEFVRNTGGIAGMYLTDQTLHIACLYIAALIIGWGS